MRDSQIMTKQTAFYVAIFSTAAVAIGWYGRRLKDARSSLASAVQKLPGLRNDRDSLAGIVALVAVVFAVVLYVIATKHR
jgi:hypothetical protein